MLARPGIVAGGIGLILVTLLLIVYMSRHSTTGPTSLPCPAGYARLHGKCTQLAASKVVLADKPYCKNRLAPSMTLDDCVTYSSMGLCHVAAGGHDQTISQYVQRHCQETCALTGAAVNCKLKPSTTGEANRKVATTFNESDKSIDAPECYTTMVKDKCKEPCVWVQMGSDNGVCTQTHVVQKHASSLSLMQSEVEDARTLVNDLYQNANEYSQTNYETRLKTAETEAMHKIFDEEKALAKKHCQDYKAIMWGGVVVGGSWSTGGASNNGTDYHYSAPPNLKGDAAVTLTGSAMVADGLSDPSDLRKVCPSYACSQGDSTDPSTLLPLGACCHVPGGYFWQNARTKDYDPNATEDLTKLSLSRSQQLCGEPWSIAAGV